MFKVKTLNKISAKGLNVLDKSKYDISDTHDKYDAVVLRSASMHEMELPNSLLAIARAGAGVNNIPVDKCSENGIVVFNTPGANANAVKELVLAGLLLSSRKVVDGINWAQTLTGDDVAKQVEKGKSAFVGPELQDKKLGIIGLGAIGVMVANAAVKLGMTVIGFDPYLSVEAAWGLSSSVKRAANVKEIYESCDYISLHLPSNDKTRKSINAEVLATMKKGVRILNYARADVVDTPAILDAIKAEKVACYVTDFPTEEVLRNPSIIPIPHLGASTPESEDNCARMACEELHQFLEYGNIINSVNFPDCSMERGNGERLCIAHQNIPNMVGQISSLLASENSNIAEMINKSKGNLAYTIIDLDGALPGIEDKIRKLDNVLSVRVIG